VSGQNFFISSGQDNNAFGSNQLNAIGKYDAITGATVNANLITGLHDPLYLAIADQNLLVVNVGNGVIGEYALDGTIVNASLFTKANATGIAVVGAIPEPSTYAALAGLCALAVATLMRRRANTSHGR
jgi:diphthamide biosynthesis methyltransferase